MNDYFSSSWSGVKGGRGSMKVKQNDDGTNLGEIPNLGSPVQVFHERSRFDELKQFVYFWSKKPGSLLMTLILDVCHVPDKVFISYYVGSL